MPLVVLAHYRLPDVAAEALDTLREDFSSDQEIIAAFSRCRDTLKALSWNRWADFETERAEKRSRARAFIRRHRGEKPHA